MVALRYILLGLGLAMTVTATAVDTSTGVFDERIRTLEVRSSNDRLTTGTPMIVLGSNDAVNIDFDVLTDDREYLRYEIIHCNADWQPSTLNYLEYLDGFNEGSIDDYAFSSATTVPYVHYRLTIPNPDLTPRLSGNYYVRIYDENNPDETLLRTRFCISEQTAPISVFATSRTDVDYNRSHQQLTVTVDAERTPVADLFNDAVLVIEQNGRTDNVRRIAHPLRVSGRKMIYEHQPDLIFKAGNEYRRFETVSNQWTGMGVEAIEYHAPYYNHYLYVDQPRNETQYLYDQTLKGGFVIREYNSDHGEVDADYVVVHFALEIPEIPNADIYIDSDIFGRRFSPETRMVYNRASGRYERAMLIKQGAYSYQYLTVAPGASEGHATQIEGDKYQTSNQYTILFYTRVPGERYDRLIGHVIFFTDPQ